MKPAEAALGEAPLLIARLAPARRIARRGWLLVLIASSAILSLAAAAFAVAP